MPTYLHCAPPLAMAAVLGRRRVPVSLMVTGMVASVVPDVDMLGVWYAGQPYSGVFGHRGVTHSIGFALLLGLLAALAARRFGWRWGVAFLFVSASTLSHPLLDLLTDRGIGTALFYPLISERVSLPWRPLPLAGVGLFGTARWWSECLWIGLPLLVLAAAGVAARRWVDRGLSGPRRAAAPGTPQGARSTSCAEG